MVNKNVFRRIGLVFVMMSVVWMVMAAAPDITITVNSPANNENINGTYEFVTTITDSVDNITKVEFFYDNGTSFPSFYSNSSNVPPGTYIYRGSLVTTTLANGTYLLNVTVTDSNSTNNIKSDTSITFIVANTLSDTTPPASVTGLSSIDNGTSWLLINWTNPEDSDFNHVSIYKDSNWIYNTTTNIEHSYNITGLSPGTAYLITIKTVDNTGNMETTGASITPTTDPNTPVGQVTLTFSNLRVTFSNVTTAGNTTVSTSGSPAPHSSLFNVAGLYYTISTTAIFSENATIGLTYTGLIPTGYSSTDVNLYHYKTSWENITIMRDSEKVYGNVTTFSTVALGVTPKPNIFKDSPNTGRNVATTGKEQGVFRAHSDQTANITWKLDGNPVFDNGSMAAGSISTYTATSTEGQHTVTIIATNTTTGFSGSDYWNWTVHPKTYATGNRVWDGGKGMNTQYTWSPRSFYAFYYDVNDDVGNESLEINLNSNTDRTVPKDKLIYKTAPEAVTFMYSGWGKYNVIGFMADKYFAGYRTDTNNISDRAMSTINSQQLHKVLMDDDDTHTIRTSSTYPLGDGYAVSIKDVGKGREAMISLLKDNAEVFFDFKEVGETFVYTKRVGSVNDLPIIALHISKVFMGTTDNMVQIDGIFQISESYTSVNSGNKYGMMDIDTVSDSGIIMTNRNAFTLASGSTLDIMGDLKFIVAKNESVLRFAPMVKRSGVYEVRGSISDNDTENEWTPLSFEGFYYDLDGDVGTEKLTLNQTNRNVAAEQITYSTSAMPVSFKYNALGKYNVIGFMAEKYFAGYIGENKDEKLVISTKDISTMERGQLHRVLIDDDTQRMIFAGSTLTLNDGYVIKIKDVNMGAGAAEVWLVVLKDGNEVYDDIMEKGDVFKYKKDVGAVKELPLFGLRIETIFRGKEATAAFVRGTFQISESYTSVKSSDKFGILEATVTSSGITMTNPNPTTLSRDSTLEVMKNIKFKVADSDDIRFYPFILVDGSVLSANQLAINVPSSLMVKDMISISVTSGTGTPQDNAEVSFDGEVIGITNATGKLNYTLTKAGMHNFTATKLGYEKAIKTVQISEYVDNRLNFELPEFIDQYIPVTIKVRVSGSGNLISKANITLDGAGIGSTDSSGTLTYTFTNSGKHNLVASKSGYITVQREIDIRMPFTEFKALDIKFRPDVVAKGQKVYVWSNITNSGTKEGTLPVALIINDTVVENSNVTLAPGKYGEVNFSHKVELPPGNYTVEILGQKTTMPVRDEPLNLFLVVGAITGIGAIAIYFLTSKSLISIEAIKAKLNLGAATDQEIINKQAVDNALKNLMLKFKK